MTRLELKQNHTLNLTVNGQSAILQKNNINNTPENSKLLSTIKNCLLIRYSLQT